MKEGNSKGKEPVIDVDDLSPRPKRTQSPTGVYDPNNSDLMLLFSHMRNSLEKPHC